jgi:hypothetical protein
VVALEQRQERGLRAGRALDAPEREAPLELVQVRQVQGEVLDPERGALAERGRLGRLQVRQPEDRPRLPLEREGAESAQHVDELHAHEREPVAQDHEVGVVGDVAGGRAEVQDPARRPAALAPGVHVGHHVVAQLALEALGQLEVHVLEVRAQLGELGVRDRQAELLLALGQREPDAVPGDELLLLAEVRAHCLAGVARPERALVVVVVAHAGSAG